MGLGWSLFYSSTCWADTLWTVLFQVLMLKDVVVWVILLSFFSDFVLCILLFWHPPSQQFGEAPEPHSQSIDVGAVGKVAGMALPHPTNL